MNNKFKIIIPSFNNEDWIEYNIASVLNQNYNNYEVLYVNDKSTDNTLNKVKDIVGELSNWTIINNKEKLLENGDRWESILDANIKADNAHR